MGLQPLRSSTCPQHQLGLIFFLLINSLSANCLMKSSHVLHFLFLDDECITRLLDTGSTILMESEAAFENVLTVNRHSPLGPIDPGRARFPCCIVWTPLPGISWFVPFIGHIGICREDGIILDFAGPNFVCVDNFTFGPVARYMPLNREKCCISPILTESASHDCYKKTGCNEITSWDDTLKKSTQEFQHRTYNLFTCNCHSFVAHNLNRLVYGGNHKWNVVNLAILMFFKGTWVSRTSLARSLVPFVVVFCIGLLLAGSNFLIFLAALTLILVGWFIIGTYCFKNLIQL